MFAGTVIELGKKHGISVPTNEFLYEQIKEIEKEYIVKKINLRSMKLNKYDALPSIYYLFNLFWLED